MIQDEYEVKGFSDGGVSFRKNSLWEGAMSGLRQLTRQDVLFVGGETAWLLPGE